MLSHLFYLNAPYLYKNRRREWYPPNDHNFDNDFGVIALKVMHTKCGFNFINCNSRQTVEHDFASFIIFATVNKKFVLCTFKMFIILLRTSAKPKRTLPPIEIFFLKTLWCSFLIRFFISKEFRCSTLIGKINSFINQYYQTPFLQYYQRKPTVSTYVRWSFAL